LSAGPELRITGQPGDTYRIECQDVLAQGPWTTLGTFTLTNNPTIVHDPALSPIGSRFYRTVTQP